MLFIVVVGILIGITAGIALVFVFPMFFMHPLASGKVEGTDIIAIKNRINNLFLIPSGDGWIAIDAGSDAAAVKREMEQMQIDERRVTEIFLTHTDYDHVASLTLFSNAVIYMNEQEKRMIDGSIRRQLLKKNRLPQLSGSNQIVWMKEHEVVNAGRHRVRMIPAPGHTKGSAMYAVDEKYLFTGDAFKAANHRIMIHPYSMDKRQAKVTIRGIKDGLKKYEKVFTAHYGIV